VCMKSAIHHPNVPGWRLHLQRGMNRLFSSLTPERAWFRHTQDLGFAPRPRIPASFQPRPVEAFTGEPTRCYALATSSSTLSPAAQLPLDGVMPSPVVMRGVIRAIRRAGVRWERQQRPGIARSVTWRCGGQVRAVGVDGARGCALHARAGLVLDGVPDAATHASLQLRPVSSRQTDKHSANAPRCTRSCASRCPSLSGTARLRAC
jgi:hypothetical protein